METFVIAVVAGVGVGVLSGLLGIGGGMIMVPLFRLVFGMDAIAATGTSLFTIVPTSISGMGKHARNKTSVVKIGVTCGLFGACLSPLGVLAADASPAWLIMAVAATVIVYSATTMLSKALKASKGEIRADDQGVQHNKATGEHKRVGTAQSGNPTAVAQDGESSPAVQDGYVSAAQQAFAPDSVQPDPMAKEAAFIASFRFSAASFVTAALIGMAAGFMGGYVGVGGGFIMVPLFVSLLGVPMRLASGTSLTAVCILAVPGVVEQAVLGNINFAVGIAMAIGSIPGAVLGANLVKRIPERTLRIFFACFLVVVAIVLILNETGLLF